ncbi:MAG: DUF4340 domain-containing protein [Verrucomicrobiae bacterium]|nr:DUF4340 domain-containing protein [Verrucomicrobiae bacterium]
MQSRSTWFWFGLAVALFLFIVFFERHWTKPLPEAGAAGPLLPGFKPDEVTHLEIRHTNYVARLQRQGDHWRLLAPVAYPANPVVVQNLLQHLARLDRRMLIRTKSFADFGLAPALTTVHWQQGTQQMSLEVGLPSPTGEQVYVRTPHGEGVYLADIALLKEALPPEANAWRSFALLASPTNFMFDRFEVRSATRGLGFALQYQPTNRTWRLGKPMQARAHQQRASQLVLACLEARVARFVTDDPKADPELFGCAPPELELILGSGTNDLLIVQFGASPTNDPALVYARSLAHTNVVLVSRDLVDRLRTPHKELRDRHLFTFDPAQVQVIEVSGAHPFTVRRQADNAWRLTQPDDLAADPVLVKELLGDLYSWEVADFEKDVVTDFTAYGLAPPWREVTLRLAATNGASSILSQAALSTNVAGKFYARRSDESSVFSIEEASLYRLPQYGWQLRERHLWSYALTNVVRVTLREGNRVNQLIRVDTNRWSFGPNSQGIMNEFAVEETVFRLGDLNAIYWVDRGEGARERHGFNAGSPRLEIEVRTPGSERFQMYALEFGPPRQQGVPLVCVTLEGQPWILEFPAPLYHLLMRELPWPRSPASATP